MQPSPSLSSSELLSDPWRGRARSAGGVVTAVPLARIVPPAEAAVAGLAIAGRHGHPCAHCTRTLAALKHTAPHQHRACGEADGGGWRAAAATAPRPAPCPAAPALRARLTPRAPARAAGRALGTSEARAARAAALATTATEEARRLVERVAAAFSLGRRVLGGVTSINAKTYTNPTTIINRRAGRRDFSQKKEPIAQQGQEWNTLWASKCFKTQ
jgi:hypothetical protein